MVSRFNYALAVSMMFGVLASFSTQADQELPAVTEEGLHLIKDSKLAVVYAKPEVDLSVYSRVMLVDAGVAFKKNWQRDQNRSNRFKVKTKDMERIQRDLAELFRQVFAEQLSAGGYELADERAEDVLVVRPAIVNLDVYAPDVSSPSRTYQITTSAGEMTLYIELYDAPTMDLLAKAMDRRRDRDTGFATWQSKVSNRAAARRILKDWADVLVQALDNAHGAAGGESE